MTRLSPFFLVGAMAGFTLASCADTTTTGKAACASKSDCETQQVCLPTGACARACTESTSCLTGQKCSAAGGCVSKSGCGTDADCASGMTCRSNGTCGAGGASNTGGGDASNGSGGSGNSEGTGGSGGTDGTGGSGGAGATGGSGGATGGGTGGANSTGTLDAGCGEAFTPIVTEANLMIVLDKSSSMLESVGGSSKWDAAVAAIKKVMSQYPSIHFGLEMFSANPETTSSSSKCEEGAGKIYVNIAPNTQDAIASAMVAADGNGTPIAGGISVGAKDPALLDPTRTEGVVVVTDGNENCGGDPVAEVTALLARPVSVRTWVVGFGSGVDPRTLNAMAVAGGTARASDPRYYQADEPLELMAALAAIARNATCSFTLTQPPPGTADGGVPDLSQITITINGQPVTLDPAHVSGWDYDPKTMRLTLYGAACESLASGGGTSAAQVGVAYSCGGGEEAAEEPEEEPIDIDDDVPTPRRDAGSP